METKNIEKYFERKEVIDCIKKDFEKPRYMGSDWDRLITEKVEEIQALKGNEDLALVRTKGTDKYTEYFPGWMGNQERRRIEEEFSQLYLYKKITDNPKDCDAYMLSRGKNMKNLGGKFENGEIRIKFDYEDKDGNIKKTEYSAPLKDYR